MTIAQSRLIEMQNALNAPVEAPAGYLAHFALPCDDAKAIIDELIQQRADRAKVQDENWQLQKERADIEALDKRLSKVEDQLTGTLERDLGESFRRVNERLAKAEGNLTTALIEGAYDRARLDEFETRVIGLLDAHSTDIAALKFPDGEKQDGAASPTGTATTVEEVLEQVQEAGQPSDDGPPRRGDRVRLEGARSIGGNHITNGWYDVVGCVALDFQIGKPDGGLYWVQKDDPGLKEVRRDAANLPE